MMMTQNSQNKIDWRAFQKAEGLSDAELANFILRIEADRCKKDLFYLTQNVLGYADLAPEHRAVCAVVSSVNPLIMELAASRARLNDKKVSSGTNSGVGVEGEGLGLTPTQNFIKFPGSKIESINLSDIRFRRPDIDEKMAAYVKWVEAARTRLFLMFRGSFKSTIITIAHTIQLMLLWPDIRILIASHKKEGGSQEILGAIKRHFIGNDRFRELFPEYCPKPNQTGQIDWGTSERVTLPNRSGNLVVPEATIEIAGSTTDVTGRHYDYIKADDLVTRDSVTNETMLAKTEQFAALLQFLFNQPEWGILDYIGTPYHFADLYAGLRESEVTSIIVPVWNKEHQPTIPSRFTQQGIEAIKNHPSMTSFDFSAQYELNPVPEEDQTFRPEYWKRPGFYYDELPEKLKVYVFVDPANKQRKDSDYTALVTIGVDQNGDLYLIDIIRDKLTLEARARLVYEMLRKHGIKIVHYESIGFQSSDHKAIKDIGLRNDYNISIVEIKASSQSKEDRIRGLQYFYEQGKVHWPKHYHYHSKYHNRTMDMVDVMRREMWMFPKCDKDDLADAHSFILRTSIIKASTSRPKEEKDTLERVLEKFTNASKTMKLHHRKGEIPYRETLW